MADKKDDKKKAPDAAVEGEDGAPKGKSKLVMILLVVVGVLILVGGSVGATLFLTGFFDAKPPAAAAAADGAVAEGEEGAAAGDATVPDGSPPGAPKLETKTVPAEQRFAATYSPVERDFTLNVPNSRRYVQFRIAYKTFYGSQIVDRVNKHQIAVEAAIINTVALYSEEEMVSVEGRARLAAALRDAINDVLIRNEDFGGLEEVMFTHFVFQ